MVCVVGSGLQRTLSRSHQRTTGVDQKLFGKGITHYPENKRGVQIAIRGIKRLTGNSRCLHCHVTPQFRGDCLKIEDFSVDSAPS